MLCCLCRDVLGFGLLRSRAAAMAVLLTAFQHRRQVLLQTGVSSALTLFSSVAMSISTGKPPQPPTTRCAGIAHYPPAAAPPAAFRGTATQRIASKSWISKSMMSEVPVQILSHWECNPHGCGHSTLICPPAPPHCGYFSRNHTCLRHS